ncbi:hypothetical protein PTKIN_Ptkin18bG0151500 [Pterospermum kingtungense]
MSRRVNRIAVAFNEAARAPMRLCQSSGSEHSPEDSADLSDLVNSFFETDCDIQSDEGKVHQEEEEAEEEEEEDDSGGHWSESDAKHKLQSLLSNANDGSLALEEVVKQKIRKETEHACQLINGDRLSDGFKRRLMSHLRDKGFDAGLCKSQWQKMGHYIGGSHEYVDVKINGIRYIVEVNLAGEFEMARPTTSYASLLEVIPPIYVGKTKELKQIVKLMCKAMRESMKSREMHTPPWRRTGYMQSKWFARYRRTINGIPVRNASQFDASATAPPMGFEAIPTISFHCRDNFGSKAGSKVGYLAAVFNDTG